MTKNYITLNPSIKEKQKKLDLLMTKLLEDKTNKLMKEHCLSRIKNLTLS